MTKRPPYEDKLHLDMPLGEAMDRLVGVDPKEMHANIKRAKQRKPPGGSEPPPDDTTNVEDLRAARIKKRNRGR